MENGKDGVKFIRYLYPLSTIGDFNTQILVTILIIYAATKLNASTSQVGWISSAFGLSYLIMPAILGKIGDRLPRKLSLLIATGLQTGLTGLFIIILQNPGSGFYFQIILLSVFFGCAYGFFWPSIEAFISESTEESPLLHRKSIANLCVSWGLGNALGPWAAGYFSDSQILAGFFLVLILYSIGFLLVVFFIPNKPIAPLFKEVVGNIEINNNTSSDLSNNRLLIRTQQSVLLILFGMMIYAVLAKVIFSYFTNYAVIREGLNWSGSLTGQVVLFVGLGRLLFFFLGRHTTPNFRLYPQSFLILGLILVSLIWVRDPVIISILFFIFGFFIGRVYYSSLELLMKQENSAKGAKAGLFESAIGLGASLSPLIAGFLGEILIILPFIVFGLFPLVFGAIHLYLQKKMVLF
jgi:MFS family permease